MKKILLSAICFLLVAACGRPKGVLSEEKMEAVLWDIAKGSEFVNSYVYYRYPQLNHAAINQEVLRKIFTLHNITKEQFDKSLDYYQRKPDVFAALLDSINVQQTRKKLPPGEAKAFDSARAAQPDPSIKPGLPSRIHPQ
ncbi:hypothetical protein A8C56_01820 [Niabella ginsenosidivorans]|uniref:DUF4296 domain-containing protein n=1 Tax=Niabella ginsenosidivorans TaxID=1176587 RepID=A0A1A9HZJ2_9BACT|nr:DUF4296 domain-containing protein [Niabella ginsenosidivorans]ANH79881.1 hypothetical protein A8C56_01820 [Niabella ginsenosidivorans]